MCNGSIMDKLISFALPLMVSSILQLMFNAVDIIVIGRFSGSQSLAAVGSTTALIAVFTNLFIGISLGANVLAARFYAAGRHKEMSETVHTAITLALISGILMAVIGQLFARSALELMATPDDVINLSSLYLRIYFLGMPFFMLYNYGAAILRAVGDTKRPLFFRIRQCHPESAPCHCFSSGCGRCRYFDSYCTDDLMYPCPDLSLPFRQQLPASLFKAENPAPVYETDFSGGCPCRYPEYRH